MSHSQRGTEKPRLLPCSRKHVVDILGFGGQINSTNISHPFGFPAHPPHWHGSAHNTMRRTFARTPQACDPWYVSCKEIADLSKQPFTETSLKFSRRRKTKCDGVRPRCKRCTDRRVSCIWSHPETPQGSGPVVPSTLSPGFSITADSSGAGRKGLKVCLGLFFERHFGCDFCSFDHRPDFEQKCEREPLLSSSVIALCGRYLECPDAQAFFGLSSGLEVSRSFLPEARSLAKASLDQPSGTLSSISRSSSNVSH